MKKSKLLIPFFTIAGAAATVAPIMTSCSQGEVEQEHFTLSSGDKATTKSSPTLSGQLTYVFTSNEEFTTEEAKMIEPIAVITGSNSYITLNRCWKQSYSNKLMTVIVSYTINPEAYEYKKVGEEKAPNEKLTFNIRIHNGTWTQTISDFSLEAQRKNS